MLWIDIESETHSVCLSLCDRMDYSPPGSSVHGILQARILEWVAVSFSRGSSWPRGQTQVCLSLQEAWIDIGAIEKIYPSDNGKMGTLL